MDTSFQTPSACGAISSAAESPPTWMKSAALSVMSSPPRSPSARRDHRSPHHRDRPAHRSRRPSSHTQTRADANARDHGFGRLRRLHPSQPRCQSQQSLRCPHRQTHAVDLMAISSGRAGSSQVRFNAHANPLSLVPRFHAPARRNRQAPEGVDRRRHPLHPGL